LIGNDHAVLGYARNGKYEAIDYNSALLFTPKKNCIPPEPQKYMKMHLVPFTEYFPYEKLFPKLYELLLNGDTHMWEHGNTAVVFNAADIKFGVPICFEDTFGNIGRRFVKNGAEAFINISNDAWSNSLACQYQHLSMAVFRCVENRVPAARATASGQTSFIDPNGKVLAMAEPFQKAYLIGEIPVCQNRKQTIYTYCGDFVGIIFAILGIMSLILGIIRNLKNHKREAL
ncbi:MAG: apolipoprotein N-acyltransferase, partial [Spirochaetaceae bacterium]|nr:apolipoprotein N-acyltransferase [Spirochaetaceae bacterium]